jgi:ABC-type bacteriocin/lantibiotic exporter with double-glycine peptidase domain
MHSYSKEHLESLSGLKWFIKQLKLYGIENKYFYNISKLHSRIRKLDTTSKFISTYPRTLLEFLLILIIIAIVSFNSQTGFNNFTTRLLFCILIIQKLLPIFSSLYVSFKDILENKYALKDLLEYLKIPNIKSNLNIDISSKEIFNIEIKNVSFKYPNQQKFILSGISLSIDFDKYYILKAPSGYGKSTLIDLMLGLQIPNKGNISYKGLKIDKNASEIVTGKFIAYVPQVNFFNDGKLKDILRAHYHDKDISDEIIYKACKTAELSSLIDSGGKFLSINCSNNLLNFSGGQRQRFAIAQALIHPKLKMIILDETFSNIDQDTCKKILKNIKNNYPKIGVLIITHDEKFAPDYYQKILLEKINKKDSQDN